MKKALRELERLLGEFETTEGEIHKLNGMAESLRADEATELKTVSLDDEASFKRISDGRLKLELIPRKIESLGVRLTELATELSEQAGKVKIEILSRAGADKAKLSESILRALAQFKPDSHFKEVVLPSVLQHFAAGHSVLRFEQEAFAANPSIEATIAAKRYLRALPEYEAPQDEKPQSKAQAA